MYAGTLRTFLRERWSGTRLAGEIEDTVQDVLVDCLNSGGPLERADHERPGGFQAYLRGIARKASLRREESARRPTRGGDLPQAEELAAPDNERASAAFDRAWARSIMREAARLQARHAAQSGEAALRRVELLELRFAADLPIRAIAERWGESADRVHHEYARARDEFRSALLEVLSIHHGGAPLALGNEAARLLDCLA